MALEEKSFKRCKYLLFVFNALFMLLGLGLVGGGVWIVLDSANFSNTFSSFIDVESIVFDTVAYVAIGVGGLIAIVAFFGCCGAITESKCLLGLFFTFTLIWVLITLAIAVAVFVVAGNLKSLLEGPTIDIIKSTYIPGTAIADAYDTVQTDYSCCGFNGGSDYANSVYALSQSRVNPWPPSCCIDQSNLNPCLDVNPPTMSNSDKGCFEPISAILSSYTGLVGGVCLGLAALMILSLVFTCCVCNSIGNNSNSVGAWN